MESKKNFKKIVYESIETKTIVDKNTGEIIDESLVHTETKKLPKEPDFVKLYCDDMCKLMDLKKSESSIFTSIIQKMSYGNIICTNEPIRSIIAESAGVSLKSLENSIKELKDKNLLIPMQRENGKIMRGWYIVNPDIAAKGQWVNIEKLRMELCYDKNGRHIEIGATFNNGEDLQDTITFNLDNIK